MVAKTRTNLTSLERLERQLQAITPDRAQGDAWEKALKGWINAGGHPELTKAWIAWDSRRTLKEPQKLEGATAFNL